MVTKRILIDSCVIIDFFRKKIKEKSLLHCLFKSEDSLYISSLTIYELLCGAKGIQLIKDTEKLLSLFEVIYFGSGEAKIASQNYIQLKNKNQLISTLDILIAATALTHSFHLATFNKNHFLRFEGLNILDI